MYNYCVVDICLVCGVLNLECTELGMWLQHWNVAITMSNLEKKTIIVVQLHFLNPSGPCDSNALFGGIRTEMYQAKICHYKPHTGNSKTALTVT